MSGLRWRLRCRRPSLRLEGLESLRNLDLLVLGLCGLSSLQRSLVVLVGSKLRDPLFPLDESGLSLSDLIGLDIVSGGHLLVLLTVRGLFAVHNHLRLQVVLNRAVALLDDVLRVLADPRHLSTSCEWLGLMIRRVVSDIHLTPGRRLRAPGVFSTCVNVACILFGGPLLVRCPRHWGKFFVFYCLSLAHPIS